MMAEELNFYSRLTYNLCGNINKKKTNFDHERKN